MVYAFEINPTTFEGAKFGDISSIVNLLMPIVTTGAALLFLVMLLYGAFTWLTSGGNPENIKKAQKIFTFSAIGLLIVVTSIIIVRLIKVILRVDIPL